MRPPPEAKPRQAFFGARFLRAEKHSLLLAFRQRKRGGTSSIPQEGSESPDVTHAAPGSRMRRGDDGPKGGTSFRAYLNN